MKIPAVRRRKAIALIIVMGVLALFMILILALFTQAGNERQGSRVYQAAYSSRTLAEAAVNLICSQIRTAAGGENTSWASQPGALRQYDNKGAFTAAYKLFSDKQMIEATETMLVGDLPPTNWDSKDNSAHYTDMNAPLQRTSSSGLKTWDFPIFDPGSRQTAIPATSFMNGKTEGFTFANGAVNQVKDDRLAMPVEWIYVLKDGTMGTLSDGTHEFAGPSSPTSANPIVGRVAFWADDESCKINLNTASEPTAWDTPKAGDSKDRDFAKYQPSTKEYQRFPGHPAMTALSPAFYGTAVTLGMADKEKLYDYLPRVASGGSKAGTVSWVPATTVKPDSDRLFASVEEVIFTALSASPRETTATKYGMSDAVMASFASRARGFLTTQSRSPELTLFGTPRISIWPIADERRVRATSVPSNAASVTPYDTLVRHCATLGTAGGPTPNDYFFRRWNADSATQDWDTIDRNQKLYAYLQALTARPIPGYGGNFLNKYKEQNRDQILTEIFDYIRSINLYDSFLPKPAYAGKAVPNSNVNTPQFTDPRQVLPQNIIQDGDPDCWTCGMAKGHGQVTPIRINNTRGFGRFHTLSEVTMHFICTADGGGGTSGAYGPPGGAPPATWKSQAFYSNLPPEPTGTSPAGYTAATFAPAYVATNWNHTLEKNKPLKANERRVQAALLLEFFTPGQGDGGIYEDFQVTVGGLSSFQVDGTSLGLPASDFTKVLKAMGNAWHERCWGGSQGFRGFLAYKKVPARPPLPADIGLDADNQYPFISVPVTLDLNGKTTMGFNGGRLSIQIHTGSGARDASTLSQTIELEFPAGKFPVPTLCNYSQDNGPHGSMGSVYSSTPYPPTYWWSFNRDGAVRNQLSDCRWYPSPGDARNTCGGDRENAGRLCMVTRDPGSSGRWMQDQDVARSVVPWHGDYRLVAARNAVAPDSSLYRPHQDYANAGVALAHNLMLTRYNEFIPGNINKNPGGQMVNAGYHGLTYPDFPYRVNAEVLTTQDFDNAYGLVYDGAYINKPDEGNAFQLSSGRIPYFDENWWSQALGESYFSPNRQISSPVMFGSLPSRMFAEASWTNGLAAKDNMGTPWTTLLFRPQPGHFGASSPKDHLLLDLFWMPVVEPYAISEPFSTAGKVNMNYQMLPFTYIKRDTALRAVLKSEELLCIPKSEAFRYKTWGEAAGQNYRQPVQIAETLSQFEKAFVTDKKIFRSATEICDLHIVPANATLAQMPTYWQTNGITGDNARERPYSNLYPRLTTKSNTYTVHVRAQVLAKARSSPPATFDPALDQILSEYRGSTLIERFIDPTDETLPDYGAVPRSGSLETRYQFRIISERRFQ